MSVALHSELRFVYSQEQGKPILHVYIYIWYPSVPTFCVKALCLRVFRADVLSADYCGVV